MGSGAGQDPPTTPFELVQVIVEPETGPATFAVPVHTVPSAAVPEKVNWPSNEDPLIVPLILPVQLTEVESQLPLTFAPDCVSTILTWAIALFDEAIVPFQVPATFVAVPKGAGEGAVELPPHAAATTAKHTMNTIRIRVSKFGPMKEPLG